MDKRRKIKTTRYTSKAGLVKHRFTGSHIRIYPVASCRLEVDKKEGAGFNCGRGLELDNVLPFDAVFKITGTKTRAVEILELY